MGQASRKLPRAAWHSSSHVSAQRQDEDSRSLVAAWRCLYVSETKTGRSWSGWRGANGLVVPVPVRRHDAWRDGRWDRVEEGEMEVDLWGY